MICLRLCAADYPAPGKGEGFSLSAHWLGDLIHIAAIISASPCLRLSLFLEGLELILRVQTCETIGNLVQPESSSSLSICWQILKPI